MNTLRHPLHPSLPRSPDPVLAGWLDRCTPLSPEYDVALSTHLPMALHALQALGAPPARLAALFDRVAPRLPLRQVPTAPVAPAADWAAHCGRFEDFETLHASFSAIAGREGPGALLAQVVPRLLPGVAAAAFHGLIRTAHGVAAGHTGEVVAGLAYWAARYQTLPVDAACAPRPAADWLAALQALPAPGGPPLRLITQRMDAWSQVPGFAAAASSLALGPDTLPGLARQAAALYAHSGNFTVLHAVTACHALTVLQAWLPEDPAALRPVTVALAAALVSTGLPRLHAPAPGTAPPWGPTVERAQASDDEHVIKLVQACQALAAADPQPAFAAAAARAVGGWQPSTASASGPDGAAPAPGAPGRAPQPLEVRP